MLIEPFTTFVVPTVYCAYMELKLRAGLRDELLEMSLDDEAFVSTSSDTVAA